MRKLLLWLTALGAVAGFLVYRRRGSEPEAETVAPAADPAEELRRKLEETRESVPEADTTPLAEEDLEARRRGVHERGRSATDEMRRSTSD